MELSVSVQEAVQASLDAMRADPIHDLAWPYRKRLYAALQSQPGGQTAPGWLALLAAERVRPIAEAAVRAEWGDEADQRIQRDLHDWLWLARGILMSLVENDLGWAIACDAHYHAGYMRGYDGDIIYADCAAQEALHEVSGGDPEFYVRAQEMADAAGAAAWAWAGRVGRHPCNPEKLKAFWEWWLLQAVPAASHLAQHPPPY